MATKEHLILSGQIKEVHKNLRRKCKKIGPINAWNEHLNDKDQLDSYSQAMKQLATKFWDENLNGNEMSNENRIQWSVQFCLNYFQDTKIRNHNREKEKRIYELILDRVEVEVPNLKSNDCEQKIRLLDVGSCYNPFKQNDNFSVTAIDISPACPDVHRCDFLNVPIMESEFVEQTEQNQNSLIITSCSYDVVIFSLLLEYMPTSEQRISCCRKAYEILDSEGILIIITPDSKHVGGNAKLMKNWRYTLALMGFSRIKYEKLIHITCMVFRKSLFKDVTLRWAKIHKEDYMTNDLFIPQDFNDFEDNSDDIN